MGKVERVICLDAPPSEEHYSYARLMSEADQDTHLVPAISNLSPNHISIVIYTSGQHDDDDDGGDGIDDSSGSSSSAEYVASCYAEASL